MDYLEKYNLKKEDITKIRKRFNKDIVNKFEVMEDNVCKVLDYLTSLNIKNIKNLILNRPDICFMDVDILKEKISKFDSQLIKFVFDEDEQNLMNFDIQKM